MTTTTRQDGITPSPILLDRAALTGGRWVTLHPHGKEGGRPSMSRSIYRQRFTCPPLKACDFAFLAI